MSEEIFLGSLDLFRPGWGVWICNGRHNTMCWECRGVTFVGGDVAPLLTLGQMSAWEYLPDEIIELIMWLRRQMLAAMMPRRRLTVAIPTVGNWPAASRWRYLLTLADESGLIPPEYLG